MELFVYGTLADPTVADEVLAAHAYGPAAVVEGLRRVEGRYPTLVPGGTTAGRLLRTDDVESLDRYEGVERDLYVRVRLPRVDGGWVQTYVGDPAALGAPGRWPREGALADRVAAYVREHGVTVRVRG